MEKMKKVPHSLNKATKGYGYMTMWNLKPPNMKSTEIILSGQN